LHAAEVEGGSLEGGKEKSGGFRFELAGGDEANDLHEGDLDRVAVLEEGHGEGERLGRLLGFEGDLLALPFLVEVTEAAFAKRRAAALGAIGFDMGTTRNMNVVEHKKFLQFARDLFESMRYVGLGAQIFEFKGLTGKIGKTKELTGTKSFSRVALCAEALIDMVWSIGS